MAAWQHRVARDSKGKLHFVFARYSASDPRRRCGMIGGIFNEGTTLEDMRSLVRELDAACNNPIIDMTEDGFEPDEDDDLNDGDG
jgi:hypothetical protein